MNNLEYIKNHLKKDPFKNINILNFIDINTITYAEKIGDSVFIKGISDREWIYISCTNKNELQLIKSELTDQNKNFGAIEEWMVPVLSEGKEIDWELPTIQYYLPAAVIVPSPKAIIRTLKEKEAKIIFKHSDYKEFINLEYIQSRIQNDISVGIRDNKQLVAWGLIQDDGAMGFLHVVPEYRKQGYGYQITLALIEKIRQADKLPFACIVKDNEKSINLVKKLGFKKDKNKHWFGLK